MLRFLQLSLVGMVLSLSALGQEWRPSITHDKDVSFLGIVSNTRFVSASNDGLVIVWNHEVGTTPSPLHRIDVRQRISTGVLSRSKDVAFLGTVEGDVMAVDLNRGVEMWHFQTEKLEFEKSFGEGLAMVTAIDCQDGLVGFGTLNGQLFFIDAHTGLELVSFTASQLQRSPFRFHDLVQKDETLGEYAREWCPPLSRIGSIQFLPDLNEVIVGG